MTMLEIMKITEQKRNKIINEINIMTGILSDDSPNIDTPTPIERGIAGINPNTNAVNIVLTYQYFLRLSLGADS